jgi:hypothetical protein
MNILLHLASNPVKVDVQPMTYLLLMTQRLQMMRLKQKKVRVGMDASTILVAETEALTC